MRDRLNEFARKSTLNNVEFSKNSRQKVMQRVSNISKKNRYAIWGKKTLSAAALIILLTIPGYFIIDSLPNQTSAPGDSKSSVQEDNAEMARESSTVTPETPPAEKLESRYRDLTQPEVNELEVIRYDSMNELISAFTDVMSPRLAEQTAEDLFRESDGNLFAKGIDAPPLFLTDDDYKLSQISDTRYKLVQTTKTEQKGQYRIAITYQYQEDHWIIQERQVTYPEN